MGVCRRTREEKALADIYSANATPYLDQPKPSRGDIRDEQIGAVMSSAKYLNEHLHEVPTMLIPCLEGRPDGAPAGMSASFWGDTVACGVELHAGAALARPRFGMDDAASDRRRRRAGRRILGIPFEKYSQGGLLPIAYTKGTDFRPAKRLPAEQFAHWNGW